MAGRLRITRLLVERTGGRVAVDLELGPFSLVGRGEGGVGPEEGIRAAASAAVDALNRGLPAHWRLGFEGALTRPVGHREAVIVELRLQAPVEEVEERLVGTAVTDRIPEEAAVKAVLNAAERRASKIISSTADYPSA
jgi:hypothetical protein